MSSKRKHLTVTLFQKQEILKMLDNGISRHIIMREYNIGSSTVYDIKTNKDKLKHFVTEVRTAAFVQLVSIKNIRGETHWLVLQ